jgi:hypothetical protein
MPFRALRLARALPLLSLVAACGTSQAQSAYTLTVLRSPTTYPMEATDMDNAGRVVGQTSVYALGVAEGAPGLLVPTFRVRQQGATWSASTASSITGSKTANYYVPYRMGESGITMGYKSSVAERFSGGQLFSDQGGTVAAVPASQEFFTFYESALGGINKSGAVALSAYNLGRDEQYPLGSYAVVLSAGQMSILERPNNPWNQGRSYANSINDQGMVAGTLSGFITELTPGVDYNIQAAVWTNGKLTWLGPLQTEARVVNNAGQVLVAKGRSEPRSQESGANNWRYKDIANPVKGSAFVLLGNVVQTIGRDDQVVNATDMNNAGTVVGCIDNVPFIWKNGVLLDLVKEVNSKGAKLPSGVVVECPIAINDSGSILTSYRARQSSTTRTWVRINAKP